jgi:hypothetical protein
LPPSVIAAWEPHSCRWTSPEVTFCSLGRHGAFAVSFEPQQPGVRLAGAL